MCLCCLRSGPRNRVESVEGQVASRACIQLEVPFIQSLSSLLFAADPALALPPPSGSTPGLVFAVVKVGGGDLGATCIRTSLVSLPGIAMPIETLKPN